MKPTMRACEDSLHQYTQKARAVLLVGVFIASCAAASQNPMTVAPGADDPKMRIDSLLNLSWSLARSQPAESLDMLQQVETIQATQDTAYKEDVVYYYYGVFYKNLNRFDESEANFNKYEAYHKERNNNKNLAAVNLVKANLYSDKGDMVKSMEAISNALRYYEVLEDTMGMIRASSKMGYILSEAGRQDEAMERHRWSNKLSILKKNIDEESITYTNMALVYEKKSMLDSAYAFHLKAYAISERQQDDYSKVINRYNVGNILDEMGKMEASIPYITACMQLADSIDIPSLRVASRQLLAKLKMQQGKPNEAITLLDSLATHLNHELGLKDKMEVHGQLAEALGQIGDYKSAFGHQATFKQLSDSLLGLESRNKLNELEIQYESEKNKQQIAFLDLENQASMALIAQKDRTILIGGAGLLLISIFSIGLYILIKKYQRQKVALSKALADKDLLLREIHHRVKNNLQIVSSLLSLQGRSIMDETALQAINDGKSRVRSMALIHQNLYQLENLTGVNMQQYVRNLCSELFQTYRADEDKVALELNVESLELDIDTLVPLGLIVNELITNTLKYAFPGERTGSLKVTFQKLTNSLLLEVADNGVGYEEENVRPNSFGRSLMQSLVAQLEGTMEVDCTGGTTVRLEIPA